MSISVTYVYVCEYPTIYNQYKWDQFLADIGQKIICSQKSTFDVITKDGSGELIETHKTIIIVV